MYKPNYETHGRVTLKRVKVKKDVFFIGGAMKAEAGAVGLLAGTHDGRGTVTFEYHNNDGLFIEVDGSGRKILQIDLLDLEYD